MKNQLSNHVSNDGSYFFQKFVEADALLDGHFKLASGRHSNLYFQCAKLFEDTQLGSEIGSCLAQRVREEISEQVDVCVAPAIGGIVAGYELARQLGARSVFFERVNGDFCLRRGFDVPTGSRVLVVEDVVTTGGSLKTCVDLARACGAEVIGACSVVKRASFKSPIGVPFVCLLDVDVPTYSPDELPDELKHLPVTVPGSSAAITTS